jgi:hypothetical protein
MYVSMENDVVYIRAQDWWPEPKPEGHCLKLLKSICRTHCYYYPGCKQMGQAHLGMDEGEWLSRG